MLAVDREWAGKTERNLRNASEVLDVALQDMRVKGKMIDMLQFGSGVFLNELLTRLDGGLAIVIGGVTRNMDAALLFVGNRAIHFERQHTERRGLELNLDLVLAQF